tara:strand:+ start:1596 stop:1892 length:297 start_codon:yes stop_codon:yes gene_type:complete
MDNTLTQSRNYIDPVLKEESRKEWEQSFNNATDDPQQAPHFSKKTNTYKGAVVQPYEQALAQHSGFSANTSYSQGVNGSAFDTTLTRYSPNVAEQINF